MKRLTMIEYFVANGQAFLPINAKGKGDIVQLIFKNGSIKLLDIQASTFLKHILTFFATDLHSLRNRYGGVIGKKQMIPLPLARQWALIPFITRDNIGRQSRTGWLVYSYIQKITEKNPYQTTIKLLDYNIVAYNSKRFCLDQMRNTRLLLLEHERIQNFSFTCRESNCPYF